MKLYGYWRSSSAWRVRIALGIKQLEVETVPVHLLDNQQHRSEHARRNPMQQVPVLEVEHEGRTRYLGQSIAIIEYLEERYPEPPLLPADPILRARVRQLAEIVNSGIQPFQNLAVLQHLEQIAPEVDRKGWAAHFISAGLSALEALARETAGTYLVGDRVSMADVYLVPQLYAARRFGVALEGYPTLTAVDARLGELDAFHKAHADRQPDATP
jgi:maleylpyruvate isomerase